MLGAVNHVYPISISLVLPNHHGHPEGLEVELIFGFRFNGRERERDDSGLTRLQNGEACLTQYMAMLTMGACFGGCTSVKLLLM